MVLHSLFYIYIRKYYFNSRNELGEHIVSWWCKIPFNHGTIKQDNDKKKYFCIENFLKLIRGADNTTSLKAELT